MSRKRRATADNLDKVVREILLEYKGSVDETASKVALDLAKEGRQTLRKTSPKNTGHYARGWSYGKKRNGARIYNKTDGPLVHLLEFGHALRQGGRSPAIPHVMPVRDDLSGKFRPKLEAELKKIK